VAAGASGGLPLSVDASGRVDVLKVNGTSQTARDLGASVLLAADQAVNATKWGGVAVTGMPMPTYTQPTGFLAATFPATVASTTNITAGTITTVTTLTNLPAITAGWLTAAGIAADAITAAKIADGAIDTATFAAGTTIPRCTLVDTTTTNTDMLTAAAVWANGTRTLSSLSGLTVDTVTTLTNDPGGVTTLLSRLSAPRAGYLDNLSGGAVALAGSAPSWYSAPLSAAGTRSAVGMAAANLDTQLAALDADVMTRLASASYTAPDNATISAIAGYVDTEVAAVKAVTDKLDTALALNAGNYRFTAAALALAPTGGGSLTAADVLTAFRAWEPAAGYTWEDVVLDTAAALGGDVTGDGTVYLLPVTGATRLTVAGDADNNRAITRS
jgi:hypothetical protein